MRIEGPPVIHSVCHILMRFGFRSSATQAPLKATFGIKSPVVCARNRKQRSIPLQLIVKGKVRVAVLQTAELKAEFPDMLYVSVCRQYRRRLQPSRVVDEAVVRPARAIGSGLHLLHLLVEFATRQEGGVLGRRRSLVEVYSRRQVCLLYLTVPSVSDGLAGGSRCCRRRRSRR